MNNCPNCGHQLPQEDQHAAIRKELRIRGYTPGTPTWDSAMAAAIALAYSGNFPTPAAENGA